MPLSEGSVDSDESDNRSRSLTCPARLGGRRPGSLKRRSSGLHVPIWEVAERFRGEPNRRSLMERSSEHEAHHGSPSIHRKQRSDEEGLAMTLWRTLCQLSSDSTNPDKIKLDSSPPHTSPCLKEQMAGIYPAQGRSNGYPGAPYSPHLHAEGKSASGESPFDNAFVDAVLGLDNIHVADGSEINMALLQLEALTAEAQTKNPELESALPPSVRPHHDHAPDHHADPDGYGAPAPGAYRHDGYNGYGAPGSYGREDHSRQHERHHHERHHEPQQQHGAYVSEAHHVPTHERVEVGWAPPMKLSFGYAYPLHNGYAHDDYAHDGYAHDGYAHDCYAHDGYAHDGYAHDGYAHDGYAHDGYAPGGYGELPRVPVIGHQSSVASAYASNYAACMPDRCQSTPNLLTATVVPIGIQPMGMQPMGPMGGPIGSMGGGMAGGINLLSPLGPSDMDYMGMPALTLQTSDVTGSPPLDSLLDSQVPSANGRTCPRNALGRREWTAEEDEIIRDVVGQFGCRWRLIASQLLGRSDDAVRNRWSRLRGGDSDDPPGKVCSVSRNFAPETGTGVTGEPAVPPIRRRAAAAGVEVAKPERIGWTTAEDAIIISSVREIGRKWYRIAQRIPGRTEHAIRNRWQRLQKMVEEAAAAAAGACNSRRMIGALPPRLLRADVV